MKKYDISYEGDRLIIDCPDIDFGEPVSSKGQHEEYFSTEDVVYPFNNVFKYVVEVALDDCKHVDFLTDTFITQMRLAA